MTEFITGPIATIYSSHLLVAGYQTGPGSTYIDIISCPHRLWTSFPQYPQSLRAIKQNGGENSPAQRNFLQAVEIFSTWLRNFPHRFPAGQKSLRPTRRENMDFCVSLLYSITSFCINLTLIVTHGQVMRESFPHWGHDISLRYKFSTIYVDKFST